MTSNDYKASAKDIGSRAEKSVGDAKSAAQEAGTNAAEQAEGLAAQAKATAGNLYGKAQDNFRAALDTAPERASEAVSAGQRIYKRSSHQVGRRVVRQPIEALLLAGAIGYLVGWATNRG